MNTVESMVEQPPVPESAPQSNSDLEEKQPGTGTAPIETNTQTDEPSKIPQEPTFEGDDDVPQPVLETPANVEYQPESGSPAELVNLGMSFLGRLSETLTNPEATQKLISTIVQKDETDGKTYLKIPVENQKMVENAFALFAGLIGVVKK